jgi:hypothetical protein
MGIGKRSTLRRAGTRLAPAALAILTAITLAACGGSSSSKPAYCTARSDLQNAVKGLRSLNVSSGVSGLEAQLQKIQSAATTFVDKAKTELPSETSAISSSVSKLESAVKSVSSSPSAGQIASVASAATGVVTSVEKLVAETTTKCG